MPVRDVESCICEELAFREWLLTNDALCTAYNFLEEEYQKKWNAEREELPERSVSSTLRKVADAGAVSALQLTCSMHSELFNHFMC
jgi:hypothetical protein